MSGGCVCVCKAVRCLGVSLRGGGVSVWGGGQ